jgi:hypothetical protein
MNLPPASYRTVPPSASSSRFPFYLPPPPAPPGHLLHPKNESIATIQHHSIGGRGRDSSVAGGRGSGGRGTLEDGDGGQKMERGTNTSNLKRRWMAPRRRRLTVHSVQHPTPTPTNNQREQILTNQIVPSIPRNATIFSVKH